MSNCADTKGLLGLRRIRKARGKTQRELAEAAEVTRSQIGRAESGLVDVSVPVFRKLSDALGLPTHPLFLADDEAAEEAAIDA